MTAKIGYSSLHFGRFVCTMSMHFGGFVCTMSMHMHLCTLVDLHNFDALLRICLHNVNGHMHFDGFAHIGGVALEHINFVCTLSVQFGGLFCLMSIPSDSGGFVCTMSMHLDRFVCNTLSPRPRPWRVACRPITLNKQA